MKSKILTIVLILFFLIDLFPQKVGDAYAFDINNIYFPLNRKGILADVNVSPGGSGGQFAGIVFLFSGGFFLSGYSNGQLWANAVASASLVEDYVQGVVGGENDPRAVLYRVGSNDVPFGQSWQDWIDAVALGADFYDGNGDDIYNPVDLNGNNLWDLNEDCPDLLGDEMIWCIFHDGLPVSQRRWNTTLEVGIEVRQTVFAYSTVPEFENIIFIRYRIKYAGLGLPSDPDFLEEIYFGVWDDPDIGSSGNDLVGCDTLLTGEYTYNYGPDPIYGNNPPSFFVKSMSGPYAYIPGVTFIDNNGNGKYDEGIDTPLDTAYVHQGELLGIGEYPGAKNLGLSSFVHYINGDPNLNDPDSITSARNYMLGLTKIGEIIDPCNWTYGLVVGGVNCSEVNPMFWYSGDAVNNYGWICIAPRDQRQLINMGPFNLAKGDETEIFVAYNVGQGTDALSSITEVKNIATISQVLYECNFDPNCIVSVNEQINFQPTNYVLFQNFPNPFNPSTKISWQSPVSSWQTLKIYDVLGNEVTNLVDEYKPAGTYEVEWDAIEFPSGVYFYQLKTEGFVETKKMILMK